MTIETSPSLIEALSAQGLRLCGGFAPEPGDAVPALPDGRAPGWLALVGVAGSGFWPHFEASPEYRDGAPDPLDRWSRRLAEALALSLGGLALFPFGGPPHRPFLRWAERAERLPASPLGLRLHPEHGLWHSYRFALALPQSLEGDEPAPGPSALPLDLCAACAGRPCLSACPVGAFDGQSYAVQRCLEALQSMPAPDCRSRGCLARHACPVGGQQAHTPAHAGFLMASFIRAHRG